MQTPSPPPSRAASPFRTAAMRTAALLLVFLLPGCAAFEQAPPGPEPRDEPAPRSPDAGVSGPDILLERALDESAAVVRTVERFHEALSSGDTAAVLDLLLPGARIVEGGGVETREQYAAHHLGADVEFLGGLTAEDTRIHAWVEGDVAWAVATTDYTGRVRERDLDLGSAELTVLVRHPDEGWRIAAVHWSSRIRDPE